MTTTRSFSHEQGTIVEVSASAKPSEVVNAVLAGAAAPRSSSNPNRGIQFAFLFVVIFAIIVYFREEIWSVSRDVSKHPILGASEQMQIHHYLGTQWLFGSGKEVTAEQIEVERLTQGQITPRQNGTVTLEPVKQDTPKQDAEPAKNEPANPATADGSKTAGPTKPVRLRRAAMLL